MADFDHAQRQRQLDLAAALYLHPDERSPYQQLLVADYGQEMAARVRASRNQDDWPADFYGPGDPMDPLEGLAMWKMLLWGLLLIPVLERLYRLRDRLRGR